jgi:hypothetical protein
MSNLPFYAQLLHVLNDIQKVQVCDASKVYSSNQVGLIKKFKSIIQ